jgi:hypothetical protein
MSLALQNSCNAILSLFAVGANDRLFRTKSYQYVANTILREGRRVRLSSRLGLVWVGRDRAHILDDTRVKTAYLLTPKRNYRYQLRLRNFRVGFRQSQSLR